MKKATLPLSSIIVHLAANLRHNMDAAAICHQASLQSVEPLQNPIKVIEIAKIDPDSPLISGLDLIISERSDGMGLDTPWKSRPMRSYLENKIPSKTGPWAFLASGYHRVLAAHLCGHETIDSWIVDSRESVLEIDPIALVQYQLGDQERARGLKEIERFHALRILLDAGKPPSEISFMTGISLSTISKTRSILGLPDALHALWFDANGAPRSSLPEALSLRSLYAMTMLADPQNHFVASYPDLASALGIEKGPITGTPATAMSTGDTGKRGRGRPRKEQASGNQEQEQEQLVLGGTDTQSATPSTTQGATKDATPSATKDATPSATKYATPSATKDATPSATKDATQSAAPSATDKRTDVTDILIRLRKLFDDKSDVPVEYHAHWEIGRLIVLSIAEGKIGKVLDWAASICDPVAKKAKTTKKATGSTTKKAGTGKKATGSTTKKATGSTTKKTRAKKANKATGSKTQSTTNG